MGAQLSLQMRFCHITVVLSAVVALASCQRRELSRAGWGATDDPIRDAAPLTAKVLDTVELSPGMAVADIGAGAGFFTFKLAERVGPSGRVYATDIDPRMLELLRTRAHEKKAHNVTVVVAGSGTRLGLAPSSVDRILMVDVFLFDVDEDSVSPILGHAPAKDYLAACASVLRTQGRLVVVQGKRRNCKPHPDDPAGLVCEDLSGQRLAELATSTLSVVSLQAIHDRHGADVGEGPGYVLVLEKPASDPG